MNRWKGLILLGAPLLSIALYTVLPRAVYDIHGIPMHGLTEAGRVTLATAFLMAMWWFTEAIPLPATSLLPIAIFPLFRAASISEATAPFANKLIFLFLGGFLIAMAMQRWNLHKRFALHTIRLIGTEPPRLVAGFMIACAFLSMWVSNTATVVMMLPIALSVIELVGQQTDDPKEVDRFAICLLLATAYSASVGGIGTLIGTPPNALLAAFMQREYGIQISFASWLLIGLPIVILFLPIIWLLLTRVMFRLSIGEIAGGRRLIRERIQALGPMKRAEWTVLLVFAMTATLWILRPFIAKLFSVTPLAYLDDAQIAIFGALLLFILPAGDGSKEHVLNWESAQKLPWGVLILFGGGLSLASAMSRNGVAEYIAQQFSAFSGAPVFLFILSITTVVIFLTEFTSNTATAATFLPILAALATSLQMGPHFLVIPAALATSCAFMMPVATPPNALVFASGHVTVRQMSRAGLWLNLIGIFLITLSTYFTLDRVLGLAL